jgi:hypothetical protein
LGDIDGITGFARLACFSAGRSGPIPAGPLVAESIGRWRAFSAKLDPLSDFAAVIGGCHRTFEYMKQE